MSSHHVSEARWFDTLRLDGDRSDGGERGRLTVLGVRWA